MRLPVARAIAGLERADQVKGGVAGSRSERTLDAVEHASTLSRSPEGATTVAREASSAGDELHAKARASGAEEQWVTGDGQTDP